MFAKRLTKDSVGSVLCVLCAMGVFLPQSAQAGFDWTPPPAPAIQAAPSAAPSSQPAGPLTPELDAGSSLPVPVGNVESAPVQAAPIQAAPVHPTPMQPVQAAPVASQPEPLVLDNAPQPAPVAERIEAPQPLAESIAAPAPEPQPLPSSMPTRTEMASPAPTPAPDEAAIEGFGKDIPLAIALRDIVPSQYAYSFTPRDIAGTKISWRGGKAWQDVLKAALAPHGYEMAVTENQIFIFTQQGASANGSAPATMSAEPMPIAESQTQANAQPSAQPTAMQSISAKPPVMSAMDMNAVRKWQARPGTTLRQTLEGWAKETNVELNWSTPYDYPITNAFYFDGQFTQAVESLLSSFGGESPSPKGKLYPNLPEGPSVLMIN